MAKRKKSPVSKKSGNLLVYILIALIVAIFVLVLSMVRGEKHPEREIVKSEGACRVSDFSGLITQDKLAFYEGREIKIPELVAQIELQKPVLGINTGERWIEIDLSEQKLYAHEGDEVFLETAVSSGLRHTPTPIGEFRVWMKIRATKMSGGQGRYYYYLPNVPYVMFFENENVPGHKGYGLHGTYWHNDFGTPHSHGCVNLPTPIAEQLYYWTTPVMEEGKRTVRATADNQGTRIVIHE